MKLEGYVEHIIYRNAENGYSVLNLVSDEDEITVVGIFSYISEGELVELEGDYTEHPMYGQQFKSERFEVKTPKDALAMERYLASGAVKGVGAALRWRPGLSEGLGRKPLKSWSVSRSVWRRSRASVSGRPGRSPNRWRKNGISGTPWFFCRSMASP